MVLLEQKFGVLPLEIFGLQASTNFWIHLVASVLYCSIYHCTTFEKNEIEKFGILIFYVLFIRDLRIIPEGENMSIQ